MRLWTPANNKIRINELGTCRPGKNGFRASPEVGKQWLSRLVLNWPRKKETKKWREREGFPGFELFFPVFSAAAILGPIWGAIFFRFRAQARDFGHMPETLCLPVRKVPNRWTDKRLCNAQCVCVCVCVCVCGGLRVSVCVLGGMMHSKQKRCPRMHCDRKHGCGK